MHAHLDYVPQRGRMLLLVGLDLEKKFPNYQQSRGLGDRAALAPVMSYAAFETRTHCGVWVGKRRDELDRLANSRLIAGQLALIRT